MINREEIIKGLECCFTDMDRSDSMPCRSCPYGKLPKKQNCQKVMFADILALLKEQEPRVMTSSELQPDELVWIEVLQSDEIWPALLRKTDWFGYPTWAMRGYAIGGYYRHDKYGRDWRCWTAKPTEDQRLAVKWE